MAQITRKYLTAELTTGDVHEVRVLFADQLQLQRTMKARGWGNDFAQSAEANAFLFWAAARREGLLDESVTWETFLSDWLVDLAYEEKTAETYAGDGSDADPTQPANS